MLRRNMKQRIASSTRIMHQLLIPVSVNPHHHSPFPLLNRRIHPHNAHQHQPPHHTNNQHVNNCHPHNAQNHRPRLRLDPELLPLLQIPISCGAQPCRRYQCREHDHGEKRDDIEEYRDDGAEFYVEASEDPDEEDEKGIECAGPICPNRISFLKFFFTSTKSLGRS